MNWLFVFIINFTLHSFFGFGGHPNKGSQGHPEQGSPRAGFAGRGWGAARAAGAAESADGGNCMMCVSPRFSEKIEMIIHQFIEYTDQHQTQTK